MCPDDNLLAAMVQGLLDADEAHRLEVHVDGCPDCLQVLVDLAYLMDPGDAPLPRIGRYELLHEVGSGAQGTVYAAYDPELQRQVALKVMVASDPGRLKREARALAALSHAHVVPVYDVGEAAPGVYMVTALAERGTVEAWSRLPRPWREVVDVYLGAARGLAAAHRAGLVHRDIKPANLLLHDDGRALVTDFGLASTSADLEAPGGTPLYLAPEVIRGQTADRRSDQFALCVALFEALHRRRPFAGATLAALARAAEAGRIAPPRLGVPRRLARAVNRGLAGDPNDRYPSMDDLVDALQAAARPPRWGPAVGAAAAAAGIGAVVAIGAGRLPSAEAPPPAPIDPIPGRPCSPRSPIRIPPNPIRIRRRRSRPPPRPDPDPIPAPPLRRAAAGPGRCPRSDRRPGAGGGPGAPAGSAPGVVRRLRPPRGGGPRSVHRTEVLPPPVAGGAVPRGGEALRRVPQLGRARRGLGPRPDRGPGPGHQPQLPPRRRGGQGHPLRHVRVRGAARRAADLPRSGGRGPAPDRLPLRRRGASVQAVDPAAGRGQQPGRVPRREGSGAGRGRASLSGLWPVDKWCRLPI